MVGKIRGLLPTNASSAKTFNGISAKRFSQISLWAGILQRNMTLDENAEGEGHYALYSFCFECHREGATRDTKTALNGSEENREGNAVTRFRPIASFQVRRELFNVKIRQMNIVQSVFIRLQCSVKNFSMAYAIASLQLRAKILHSFQKYRKSSIFS